MVGDEALSLVSSPPPFFFPLVFFLPFLQWNEFAQGITPSCLRLLRCIDWMVLFDFMMFVLFVSVLKIIPSSSVAISKYSSQVEQI